MSNNSRNLASLMALMAMTQSVSSAHYKASGKGSLAKYSQDNFHALSLKRVKGKWRVKK